MRGDKWDSANNMIVCAINECVEEDDTDDIGLDGVQKYLNEQKQQMEPKLAQKRPEPQALDDKVKAIRLESEETISVIKIKWMLLIVKTITSSQGWRTSSKHHLAQNLKLAPPHQLNQQMIIQTQLKPIQRANLLT